MADDIGLAVTIDSTYGASALVLDLVCGEQDALAEEMCQHIKRANELYAPVERVQYVCLLCNELVIAKGHSDVFQKLVYAGVGHLMILSWDKDASGCNQGHHLLVWLASEVADWGNMLPNVRFLKISVENWDAVVEGFCVVLKFAAQALHPVNVELTWSDIEGLRVVPFA